MDKAWEALKTLSDWRRAHGFWERNRAAQARYWFLEDVKQRLLAQLAQADTKAKLEALSDAVAAGQQDPSAAAQDFVDGLNR